LSEVPITKMEKRFYGNPERQNRPPTSGHGAFG
jgi:hypothetical protein